MGRTVTFEDPQAYARAWTVPAGGTLVPDTELLETVCKENEKDGPHMVGRTEAEKQVKVVPAAWEQRRP
jgi:hypothetical protein